MEQVATKVCQNCKSSFEIAPEDFVFYEKIKVPPPTFCWRCRMQRRDTWRNERSLYKRKCDAPGHTESIISAYAPSSADSASVATSAKGAASAGKPDANYIIYDQKYWWSDGWDSLAYGAPYDFSKPFFKQFQELLAKVPLPAVANVNPVHSEYCNAADSNKNCYLSFAAGFNENVAYSNKVGFSKDCLDCYMASKLELCYENVNCHDSYRLLWGINSKSCRDSYFLYNCRNCSNCFGCVNLISKSYHIFNQPYSKEEYLAKLSSFNLTTREGIISLKEKFQKEMVANAVHRYANILNSPNCTGDNINNSKNTRVSFDVLSDAENAKFLQHSFWLKDSYDMMGAYKYELSYESVDVNIGSGNCATVVTYNANNNRYTYHCHGCSNVFGCIGLRNKEYCLLNRQYSKEEYGKLIPQIIAHMNDMPYISQRANGKEQIVYRYGEFFPAELSPWAYNETIAQEYFPLSEPEAKSKGFLWKKSEERHYEVTLPPEKIPVHTTDVSDAILNETIGCAHVRVNPHTNQRESACVEQCTTAFKIIDAELQLYRKLDLPLPNLCPNCRHYARLAQRNPLQLWERKCRCAGTASDNGVYQNTSKHFHGVGECPNEFETSYAPERPEIIYCEQCYQSEVA